MNKELVCPFCQRELLLSSYRDDDTVHHMLTCLSCQLSAQRKIWQELIRTRKALDVANNAIDEMLVLDSGKFIQEPAEMWKIAKSAKDKITTLEQKDVK